MTTTKKTTTKKAPEPILQDIHGKLYEIVASRSRRFRHDHPIESKWALIVNIIHMDESVVVMECIIKDPDGVVVAKDYAEEFRGSSPVNKTSAMENGSTSAQGRALSQAGYNATDSIASAEEVEHAINQQKNKPATKTKKTTKDVSSRNALANDRQKVEIREAFKGLSASAKKALRKELLKRAEIDLPDGIDPATFMLSDIDGLLTEAGATRFLNRPTF
jgi:hypothetical protein